MRALVGAAVLLLLPLAAPRAVADSLATTDAYLPIVHSAGASGTWVSGVVLQNPSPNSTAVRFYYTPADTDGTGRTGLTLDPDLQGQETLALSDVLANVFGLTGYGLLHVQSTLPIIVTSNTVNVAANCTGGAFGQFSPGQPLRNAIGFGTTTDFDLIAPGIPNDATHRTNATVMNPTGALLHATMELIGGDGGLLGSVNADVPPYSLHQFNDVFGVAFAAAHPPAAGDYRLDFYVNAANGAKVLAYVTVIDTRSGDPYLITASAGTVTIPTTSPTLAGVPRHTLAASAAPRLSIEMAPAPPRP